MAAVSAGTASIGDGSSYFDATEGWAYLLGNLPYKTEQVAVINPNGKRARLKGIISASATANSTTDHDWLIDQQQYPSGTNVNSVFDGIEYYSKDSSTGDHMSFQVVDKDGTGVTLGLYPQAYYDAYKDGNGVLVVEEFGNNWYVAPNALEDIVLYKAALLPGLYIRVKYHNTHATQNTEFFVNLFRHLDL
jgi:hypothetical protein